MAAQPDPGAVLDGQPGGRLPGPGPGVMRSLEILTSALVAEHKRASQPFPVPADDTYRFRPASSPGSVAVSMGGPGDHAACDAERARLRAVAAGGARAVQRAIAAAVSA